MRLPYTINKQNPTLIVHTPMNVQTMQVSNPTTSNILVATGRTDTPTLDSADYILPSGALVQLNVSGHDFVFSFATPGTLPALGNTAQIALLDHSEVVGAVGSLPLGSPAAPGVRDPQLVALGQTTAYTIPVSGHWVIARSGVVGSGTYAFSATIAGSTGFNGTIIAGSDFIGSQAQVGNHWEGFVSAGATVTPNNSPPGGVDFFFIPTLANPS